MSWGGYRLGFLLYLLAAGFLAEMAGGALGVGYGVFSTTLLIAGGLLPAAASASVHTAETVATLISAISHHQFGNVDKRLAAVLTVPGVLGAIAGALLLSRLPGEALRPWIAGLLLVMGVTILVRFVSNWDRPVPISAPFPWWMTRTAWPRLCRRRKRKPASPRGSWSSWHWWAGPWIPSAGAAGDR